MSYLQCKAKSKRTGERCKARAMLNGSGLCYHHGGKTPRGVTAPTFKHGLYSKDLAAHHLSNYQELLALGDRLFRIDDETAVITALIQDALSRIDDGESGAAWRKARTLLNEMTEIYSKGKPTDDETMRFDEMLAELDSIFNDQTMSYAARDEAAKLADLKRKFVHDERRAQAEAYKVMRYEQAMLFISAIVAGFKQALEKYVDSDTRNQILIEGQKAIDRTLKHD